MLAEQDTSIPRARETEHDMIRHSRTRMQQTFLLIPLLLLLFLLSWMVVTNPGGQRGTSVGLGTRTVWERQGQGQGKIDGIVTILLGIHIFSLSLFHVRIVALIAAITWCGCVHAGQPQGRRRAFSKGCAGN